MPAASRAREAVIVAATLCAVLLAFGLIFLARIPDAAGKLGYDYALWMPGLLAGRFWELHNGMFAVPWFSPSQCGGVPFQADPELPYFALPQYLAFFLPPLDALRLSLLAYAAAGFLGTWHLARRGFALSLPASLLAAAIFAINGFFATRMAVGHLPFEPFMLLPVLAAAVIGPAGLPRRAQLARIALAGVSIGAMIEGGAFHIVPPAILALLMLVAMGAARGAAWLGVMGRLAAGVALGVALGAGKLAGSLAFLAHFPRDQYPLPGIPSLPGAIWLALRTLFWGAPAQTDGLVVHTPWIQAPHEFAYAVGPVPLALMLAALFFVRGRGVFRHPFAWLALVTLFSMPVLLNWYQADWNALLKSLPFFGSSSNLLRWFAAYILPACIGGAIALDALASRLPAAALAACGIAVSLLWMATLGTPGAGQGGPPPYDDAAIEAAWHAASEAGHGPPVTALMVMTDPEGHLAMPPERDNALARGGSQLFCYQPVFGYRLERLPFGKLHPGAALDAADGVLNVKNPACYLYPEANACRPGDEFRADQLAEATAFLDYRPFAFRRPWWARLADATGLIALAATLGMGLGALTGARHRRTGRGRVGGEAG